MSKYPHQEGREEMWSRAEPFVQTAWDATSLSSFMQCPRRYYYEIVMGYRPKVLSADILFGSCIHDAAELYDKMRLDGADHETSLFAAIRLALRMSLGGVDSVTGEELPNLDQCGDNKKTRKCLIRALIWWADEFGADDVLRTVRMADGKPALEQSFRIPLEAVTPDGDNYVLCGHLDKVAALEGTDDIFPVERKTTKTTLGSHFFTRYTPNVQISTYAAAFKILFDVPALIGVMVEAFQTAVTFARFERHLARRTVKQSEEWLDDAEYWIKQAERCGKEHRWPMNQATCGLYGGCPFQKVCGKDPGVRDAFLKGEFRKLTWNPLANRE